MNKRTATYQTAYNHYATYVKVGEELVAVVFKDGNNGKGMFTTTDETLQKAIEADERFGLTIFLLTDYGYVAPKVEAPIVPVTPIEEVGTGETEVTLPTEPVTPIDEVGTGEAEVTLENAPIVVEPEIVPPTAYPGIATVQLAGRALRADFKVTADSVGNREKLMAKAAELNVVFPDLA